MSMSNEYNTPRNVGPSVTRVVCVVFIDDDTKEEIKVEIGRSTHLKSVFNEYAENVSTSLRQLCFSYNGKTLFLSSVKSQTADELNLNIRMTTWTVKPRRTRNATPHPLLER